MKLTLIPTKLFLITLILFGFKAKAQMGTVPAAYQPDYSRMMANQAKMTMNQNLRFAQNMLNYRYRYDPSVVVNIDHIFDVVLKDGSNRVVKSKIYLDTVAHSCYLLLINTDVPRKDPARKLKIYPKETVTISRTDEHSEEITGNPTDSCWQFKVINGKINAYSNLSEKEGIGSFYLSAIQQGNGQIIDLTPQVLEPIIKSDEKAYKAFLKKDYYKAIVKYNEDNK